MQRVLVVDDEPDVRLLCRVNLEAEGFQVSEASNGEALSIAALDKPDAIVLDLMMPGMDGWEVLSHLKADPYTEHIPVIIVTARSSQEERRRGLSEGAAAFVTKPFDPGKLGDHVREVLR